MIRTTRFDEDVILPLARQAKREDKDNEQFWESRLGTYNAVVVLGDIAMTVTNRIEIKPNVMLLIIRQACNPEHTDERGI